MIIISVKSMTDFSKSTSNSDLNSKVKTVDLSKLNLTDDILFSLLMRREDFCAKVLEIIFDKKFIKIKYNSIQETIQNMPGYKSIRLDCFAEDTDGRIYNIEMQQLHNDDMPKRSRFYQGLLDVSSLFSGKEFMYRHLPDSYIIFITDFDIFGEGLYKYTFTNQCHEIDKLELGDQTTKIFLNLKGYKKSGCTDELANFLEYIKNTRSDVPKYDRVTELSRLLENMINNDSNLRSDYMREEWNIERGREEERINGINILIEDNIENGSSDEIIIEKLCRRYNLDIKQAAYHLTRYKNFFK